MAHINLDQLRARIGPYIDYASEEVALEKEQQNVIYPTSKGDKTKEYSFPDEALEWLKMCLKYHTDCNYWAEQASDTKFLPRRLVDVGILGSESKPRLVTTENATSKDRPYLALSHRWPKSGAPILSHITTKKGNLQSRLAEIDEETLSQTLRFAFDACRWLNVRYLWVDTLCIIQDSDVDWAEQSQVMSQVYLGAVCTIYANIKEHPDRPIWTQCGYSPELSGTGWVADYFRAQKWPTSDHMWNGLLEGGELGSRGWCLQERHLSPRMMHFMESGLMMWECCCYVGALGGPHEFGPPHGEAKAENYKTRVIDLDRPTAADSDHDRSFLAHDGFRRTLQDRALQKWYLALADYSTRSLTYETDRPVAIRGLVNRTQSVTGYTQYYHGVWKEDAVRGLLWERRNRKRDCLLRAPADKNNQPDAPTWSWLSVVGPVQLCSINDEDLSPPFMQDTRRFRPLIDHTFNPLVKILGFTEHHAKFSGPVAEVKWTTVREYASPIPPEYSQVSVPNGLRVYREELETGPDSWRSMGGRQEEVAWVTLDLPCERSASTDDMIYLALLTHYYGLVLQKPGGLQKAFERIGIFRLQDKNWWRCNSQERQVILI